MMWNMREPLHVSVVSSAETPYLTELHSDLQPRDARLPLSSLLINSSTGSRFFSRSPRHLAG